MSLTCIKKYIGGNCIVATIVYVIPYFVNTIVIFYSKVQLKRSISIVGCVLWLLNRDDVRNICCEKYDRRIYIAACIISINSYVILYISTCQKSHIRTYATRLIIKKDCSTCCIDKPAPVYL